MRRRIVVAIISVTTIAVALFGIPLGIVIDRVVDEDATLRIERRAVLASRIVPDDFATNNDPVELPPPTDGIILALYDLDGRLVTGTGPAVADKTTSQALGNRVSDTEVSGLRIVAVPIAADEQVVGAIRAEQSTSTSDARTRAVTSVSDER